MATETKSSSTFCENVAIENMLEAQANDEQVSKRCTAKEKCKIFMNKAVIVVKKTCLMFTIGFISALLVGSFGAVVVGWMILKQHYEVTRVIYHEWFIKVGMVMVIFGCVNCFFFCPLGYWGSLAKKKSFLKWFNIWMLLTLLLYSITLHLSVKYGRKPEADRKKELASYSKAFYARCKIGDQTDGENKDKCGCRPNFSDSYLFWEPDSDHPENSLSYDGTKWIKSIAKKEIESGEVATDNCRDHVDYFRRTMLVFSNLRLFLLAVIIVQVGTLTFGVITAMTIPRDDVPEPIEEETEHCVVTPSYSPKMSLLKTVLIYFLVKKFFWVFFLIITPTAWYLFKILVLKKIPVEIPPELAPEGVKRETDMQELIGALFFGLIMAQLIPDPDGGRAKKRRPRRPKNKLQWILQKVRYHTGRKLLLALLTVLFIVAFFVVKLWLKNFEVYIGRKDGKGGWPINLFNLTKHFLEKHVL